MTMVEIRLFMISLRITSRRSRNGLCICAIPSTVNTSNTKNTDSFKDRLCTSSPSSTVPIFNAAPMTALYVYMGSQGTVGVS